MHSYNNTHHSIHESGFAAALWACDGHHLIANARVADAVLPDEMFNARLIEFTVSIDHLQDV